MVIHGQETEIPKKWMCFRNSTAWLGASSSSLTNGAEEPTMGRQLYAPGPQSSVAGDQGANRRPGFSYRQGHHGSFP